MKIIIWKDKSMLFNINWNEILVENEKSFSVYRDWKVIYNIIDWWIQYKCSNLYPKTRIETMKHLLNYMIDESKNWTCKEISRFLLLWKDLEILDIWIDF